MRSIKRFYSDGSLTFQRCYSDSPGFPEADAGHGAAELWMPAVPSRLLLLVNHQATSIHEMHDLLPARMFLVPGSAPSMPVENGGREL